MDAWVVYPERNDNAPVVVVIHEIFGLTDWIRGVTDQLAAEGFITIAPDLLSGKAPGGNIEIWYYQLLLGRGNKFFLCSGTD